MKIGIIITFGYKSIWSRIKEVFRPKARTISFSVSVVNEFLSIEELEGECLIISAKLLKNQVSVKGD